MLRYVIVANDVNTPHLVLFTEVIQMESIQDELMDEPIILTQEERDLSYELDKEILRERLLSGVDLTTYLPNRLDKSQYIKAKRRLYYENAKKKNLNLLRQQARNSYYRRKAKIRLQQSSYYLNNKEEILDQKKGYYNTNKSSILQKRKDNYIPHPLTVKTDEVSSYNRQKSLRSYHNCKDDISTRRKQRRQHIKEVWNIVNMKSFKIRNKTYNYLLIKQRTSPDLTYTISQVVDVYQTPLSIGKTGVTFPFKYVLEQRDGTSSIISLNTIRKHYSWFLEQE